RSAAPAGREHRTGPRFPMNVLVTGIGGFAGPPVARALLARGHAVAGVLRPPLERPRLEGLPLTLHAFDLLDPERLRAVVAGAGARPFNHTGPGQDAAFVCAALARQIACIEAGRQEAVVHAGNLDPVRDFSDVNDVAAGYVALLERGRSGAAYNLCSATGCSI